MSMNRHQFIREFLHRAGYHELIYPQLLVLFEFNTRNPIPYEDLATGTGLNKARLRAVVRQLVKKKYLHELSNDSYILSDNGVAYVKHLLLLEDGQDAHP